MAKPKPKPQPAPAPAESSDEELPQPITVEQENAMLRSQLASAHGTIGELIEFNKHLKGLLAQAGINA